jgi:hypothetical protein
MEVKMKEKRLIFYAIAFISIIIHLSCGDITTTGISEKCGNGKLDEGEHCDINIQDGEGACPIFCHVEGKPCTLISAKIIGEQCQQRCEVVSSTIITEPINGDGCCPEGANEQNDSDCSSTTPPTGKFQFTGKIVPGPGHENEIPAQAKVMIFWSVTWNSPDYLYKWGEGTSTGNKFSVSLPSSIPPHGALNHGELGVGWMFLTKNDYEIPEGKIKKEEFADRTKFLGASGKYALIYRVQNPAIETVKNNWPRHFPPGISCGVGAPDDADEDPFDEFKPIKCEEVEIIIDTLDHIEFVNWT